MTPVSNNLNSQDIFDLNRFISAQQGVYDRVLAELNNGKKRSHWMWYVFPQFQGLGQSQTSKYYAIKTREEAIAYFNHPILGKRLKECTEAVINIKRKSVSEIFGYPDDRKLKSSMTLFSSATSDPLFDRVLDRYFHSEKDEKTLRLLEKSDDNHSAISTVI